MIQASRLRRAGSVQAATLLWSPRAGATGSPVRFFEYKRDDAFDAASSYDNEKQELSLDQFGGSLGGPVVQNRSFFFASFERLRQRTGLRFTEAVPSVEARRRIAAGEPVGSGAGQSGDRTRAVAPCSQVSSGTTPTSNPLDLATLDTQADQTENTVAVRVDHRFNDSQSMYVRYQISDGEIDTPDRTVTARRVREAAAAEFRVQSPESADKAS